MTDISASGLLSSMVILLAILLVTAGIAAVGGYLAGRAAGKAAAESRSRTDEDAWAQRVAAAEAAATAERADSREGLARLSGRLETERAAHARTQQDLAWQRQQNGELDKKMAPMREAFQNLTKRVQDSDSERLKAQTELRERVSQMAKDFGQATADVRHEARKLSTVLSRNDRRGAWGEMQLRSLVESSGMLSHVNFVEQDHTVTPDGRTLRPDMVVNLAGGRQIVVDSKVPLDAFLRLQDAEDESTVLAEHARLVVSHINGLSSKDYWKTYDSPEFVIMFIPSEGLLSAALEARPDLIQFGLDRKVLLATPVTLMAMLHTVTHSWRQVEAAQQAKEIQQLGAEFYDRVLKMASQFEKLRKSIDRTVTDYNGLVGTMESRVLPSGRKMESLSVADIPIEHLDEVAEPTRDLKPGAWPGIDFEFVPSAPAAADPRGGDLAIAGPDAADDELSDPQESLEGRHRDTSAA